MDFPSPKELKKLAAACRKAGIKAFKGPTFEFTLSDDAPMSNYKRSKQSTSPQPDKPFVSDSLSEEDLMFWSTADDQSVSE